LAFWRLASAVGRIEIPVEIPRIECVDPPVKGRTVPTGITNP